MASVKTSTNADGILVRKKSNPPPQYAKTQTKTNATRSHLEAPNSNTAVGSLLNVYTDMKESTNDATSMNSKEIKSETTQPTSQPTQSTKPSKSSETQNGTKLWGEMLHARYLMALFDYALQHASPKKIMKCMPKAYPSSLTTEHVKSHLQKLRVKAVDNRQYQLEICDNLLQEEYDIATGKYIGETALTESTYELYSQRFAIAKEMLTDPRRFSLELLTELKQQQQHQQHVASVNNAKNSTTAMSSQSNNNNSSSSSSSSSTTTEKDSTDIQWGDLRKLGWKWSNDHNGLGNYFYRPGISTKIQKASAVENIDVFKDISDIRSMIQIHNIKNQLLNNQDYLNRYVNYHIQNAVLLINQELDTNAHLSDLQLWNCLASKKGYVENPKVEM